LFQSQQIASASPIELAKAVKNPIEIEAMKQTHVRNNVIVASS